MSLSLQAGAGSVEGSQDPNLGIVAIKLKCLAATIAEALNGEVPDFGVVGLVENQPRTFSRRIGGDVDGYDVMITMEGHQSPGDARGEEFSLDGDLSEDPIESHPDFQLLIDKYSGTVDASTGKAKFEVTYSPSGDGGEARVDALDEGAPDERNPMHGVESYLVPGLVWTRRWVSQALPRTLTSEIGTLTNTPPGNPPEIHGRSTWLCVRIRGTKRGNIWSLDQNWKLIGPNGVAPELYPYR